MRLRVCAYGSLRLLQYQDDDALRWLCNLTSKPSQWLDGGMTVDPRLCDDLLNAFRKEGGEVVIGSGLMKTIPVGIYTHGDAGGAP